MKRFVASVGVLILAVGCSYQSTEQLGSTSKPATPVAFNKSGEPPVEFRVPDMMCPESCAVKVKEILSQQPGAKDVIVEFDSKTAKVAVDKDKFDAKQAIAALEDHQFKNSALKDAEATTTNAKPETAEAPVTQ